MPTTSAPSVCATPNSAPTASASRSVRERLQAQEHGRQTVATGGYALVSGRSHRHARPALLQPQRSLRALLGRFSRISRISNCLGRFRSHKARLCPGCRCLRRVYGRGGSTDSGGPGTPRRCVSCAYLRDSAGTGRYAPGRDENARCASQAQCADRSARLDTALPALVERMVRVLLGHATCFSLGQAAPPPGVTAAVSNGRQRNVRARSE